MTKPLSDCTPHALHENQFCNASTCQAFQLKRAVELRFGLDYQEVTMYRNQGFTVHANKKSSAFHLDQSFFKTIRDGKDIVSSSMESK